MTTASGNQNASFEKDANGPIGAIFRDADVDADDLSVVRSEAPLSEESPAFAFERFVQSSEAANAADPNGLLRALLPVWSRVDRLVIARSGVLACARDLRWVFQPDAIVIADLIRASYLAFPEIERNAGQTTLVEAIVSLQDGGSALHCCLVAHRVEPEHRGAIQAAILEFCRYGHFAAASGFIELLPSDADRDRLIGRLLSEQSAETPGAASVVLALSDRLHDVSSPAGVYLGQAVADVFLSEPSGSIEPAPLASSVARLRDMVKAGRRPARAASATAVQADVAGLLDRVLEKCGTEIRKRSRRPSRPVPSVPLRQSGVVGWLDYVLREEGMASLPMTDFRTVSGTQERDGTIVGLGRHEDAPLVYGPYITLRRGLYRVTFLGEIAPHVAITMAVTSDYGATILSTSMAFTDEGQSGEVASFTFEVTEPAHSCEFIMKVRAHQARPVIRGVTLRRASSASR